MKYRWLYRIWSVFWTTIGVLVFTALVIASISFAVLQLPFTKQKLADRALSTLEERTGLFIEFDSITGLLPFNVLVEGVSVYQDSSRATSVLSTDSVQVKLDAFRLFRGQWVISELQLIRPQMRIDQELIDQARMKKNPNSGNIPSTIMRQPDLLIPSLKLVDGRIHFDTKKGDPDSRTIEHLNSDLFVDLSDQGRYLDIERLTFDMPGLDLWEVKLFGQIFTNQETVELNAFRIWNKDVDLTFRAKADELDLSADIIADELRNAQYTMMISNLDIEPGFLKRWTAHPLAELPVRLETGIVGNADSLSLRSLTVTLGKSAFDATGHILKILDKGSLAYSADFYNILPDTAELFLIRSDLSIPVAKVLSGSFMSASINGDVSRANAGFRVESERGDISTTLDFGYSMDEPFHLESVLESLNLGGLISDRIADSDINGRVLVAASRLEDLKSANGTANVDLNATIFNGILFDSVHVDVKWDESVFRPSFDLKGPVSTLSGTGIVNVSDSLPYVELRGKGRNLQIRKLSQIDALADAEVDINYEGTVSGNNQENLFGQFSFDVPRAVIGGDTLAAHQLYMDFTEPGQNRRSVRLTSTALDMTVEGQIVPFELPSLVNYWGQLFSYRLRDEIFLRDDLLEPEDERKLADQSFTVQASLKSPGLIRYYLPEIPFFDSKARLSANVNANGQRILFNSSIQDQKFRYRDLTADSLNLQITGSFRYSEELKSFSNINIQSDAAVLTINDLTAGDVSWTVNQSEDSLTYSGTIARLGDESAGRLDGRVALTDSTVQLMIDELILGNNEYTWQNRGISSVTFNRNEELAFNEFTFENEDEYLSFEGVLSEDPLDSVNYIIRNIDLSRISRILDGKVSFSGMLNGDITTRSLTRIPTVQGELNVNALKLDENVVGDIALSSAYDAEGDRFNTQISVKTDSTKYPEYFVRQGREGQNIELNGYILAPVDGQFPVADSIFNFEVDFNNVDLWVIPFIAPNVFSEMSGKGSGKGKLWGNTEDYDFEVNYEVGYEDAVYMRPRFLDTYYYAQGPIRFTKDNGLEFQDLYVIDPSGGSAVLSGRYNLNGFQPVHTIDLTLKMDEFQFLNNSFDPTIAFFGQAYGSSTIRMTGTNMNPVLSTETPVMVSDFSDIGIPLLEETELDEGNKFIRFVDDFVRLNGNNSSTENSSTSFRNEQDNNNTELTFQERFTLDLQFEAVNPMTVQLIFDPVTGDVIRTTGTGRLRIRLQDEELSIFGRFDINGGNYQFVSGDIFTRRFRLEPGGTLIWDGQPDEARLNINAIYQARPDINTLTRARADIDTETSQRIPVELVLNIAGSLNSIQNNFFFRLPDTFETRQNSAIEAQIRALNRNEDEKLIQATSFLLMGDFIPSAAANADATNSLTNNFSGSGAVLNPLLSSQVISPLLSNQINSLLRSDIGSLDIDFNLNTYNNVDLAVALRLYNDRIILSREGQITGAQSNIGDIGATYRINQTFSITAFHRQDPTFSSLNGNEETQQTQDINGVGLEASLSFNRWEDFFRKITNPFKRLFGRKEEQGSDLVSNDYAPS